MADTNVKVNLSSLDSIKYFLFANNICTGGFGFLCGARSFRTDNTNSEIGSNSMRKTDLVSNYRAVSFCAQFNVNFVFDGGGISAGFEGAKISGLKKSFESVEENLCLESGVACSQGG